MQDPEPGAVPGKLTVRLCALAVAIGLATGAQAQSSGELDGRVMVL